MPNHLHGIIIIENQPVGASHDSPLQKQSQFINTQYNVRSISLGVIVGLFKSTVTREIHKVKRLENFNVWQRNYYEHIIRNEEEHQKIVDYIIDNPRNWKNDPEYSSL